MAQLNITLNQEEILQLLQIDRDDAFKTLLQKSLNAILMAESTELLQANAYERTEKRAGYRNGSYERDLTTRIGSFTLKVPKHRGQVPFKTMIFDNYSRSEAALVASMTEMVVNGVSTRKVSTVIETLCGKSISKSTVSELCKDLDVAVNEFRDRPLTGEYPIVTVDATYFKVREDHRIVSKALMIAYATAGNGHREIIGFGVYANESNETWKAFFTGLKKRGLKDVKLFISDSHEGIKNAIADVFPDTPWQRCQFHFNRNILSGIPKKHIEAVKEDLKKMFNSKTIEQAREIRDSIIDEYKEVAESAMACLEDGFEDAMTVMILPEEIRKKFRTSNHIERLNKELKRRYKVIGIFPNVASLNRLMGAVLMELNEKIIGGGKVFYKPTYNEIEAAAEKLKEKAAEQRQMMKA